MRPDAAIRWINAHSKMSNRIARDYANSYGKNRAGCVGAKVRTPFVTWSIIPLNLGRLHARPKDSITLGRGAGETVDLACVGWLLLGGGDPILVDAGPPSAEHTANVHKVALEKGPEHALEAALALHGLEVGDVGTVIVTHLHWDHCHGLRSLPAARVIVQDRELRYAVYPRPGDDRRKYEFLIGAPFLRDLPRIDLVDGAAEIARGVRVVPTPGHSPGHQSVLVDTRSRSYLVAGDFLDLYENWTQRCPSGSGIDEQAWQRSYDEVAKLGVDILPSHDPLVLQEHTYS